MLSNRRPAGMPAHVLDACFDDDLPILTTRTSAMTYAKRVNPAEVAIIDADGAHQIDLSLRDSISPGPPPGESPRRARRRTPR